MKVGDKVMLKSDSLYYKQAPGVVGVFVKGYEGDSEWVTIRWNQERTEGRPDEDNYPVEDVVLATKLSKLLAGVVDETV